MNFTNKYNIPEHICKWLSNDEYDYLPGIFSATTLIAPARAQISHKTYYKPEDVMAIVAVVEDKKKDMRFRKRTG